MQLLFSMALPQIKYISFLQNYSMWHRTSTYPAQHSSHNQSNSKQQSLSVRPGQIYLHQSNHLSQQNQQLIQCIKQLKSRNEEINLKIEQKLRQSRNHLQNQHSPLKQHYTPTKEDTNGGNINPEKSVQESIRQQYYSPPFRYEVQDENDRRYRAKDDTRSDSKERPKAKERSNHAYRIIIESHLRNLEQMQREGTQKQERPTINQQRVFINIVEPNPQKSTVSRLPKSYKQGDSSQSPIKKSEMNCVYLPVPQQQKQELIGKYNKKLNESKAAAYPKQTKDNQPYRTDLKRSHKYNSVYYTKKQCEEVSREYEELAEIRRHSYTRFF